MSTTCELGDLSGKFGPLVPQGSKAQGLLTDPTLDISKRDRILGLSIVIHNQTHRVSCANLESPVAVAFFTGTNGVTGSATFSKTAGGTSTQVDVAMLEFPNVKPARYYIGERGIFSEANCPAPITAYDPLGISLISGVPSCQPLNLQFCQAGDLSGKSGVLLQDGGLQRFTFTDSSLVIVDILARALVIIADDGTNNIISCSSINLAADMLSIAVASFDSGSVRGNIVFSQIGLAPATVWISLSALPTNEPLIYSVYTLPVNSSGLCEEMSTGSPFDPFGYSHLCFPLFL